MATENVFRFSQNRRVKYLILMLGLEHLSSPNCFHFKTQIPAGLFSDLLSKYVFCHSPATQWPVSLSSLFTETQHTKRLLDVLQWFVVHAVMVACISNFHHASVSPFGS